MPAATNTFQQIAGSDPGPFTQFLRPHIPIDYGQTASTPLTNTGYEGTMTGVGKGVLSFLEAVSQERRRKASQEDANTQTGIDLFQKHVAAMLANPDLTDEGRQAIQNEADAVMNEHMHYAMKDVGKDGVHGFIKNILTQATGGGIKTREPINWNEATGRLTNTQRPEHSQNANAADIISRGQAAEAALRKEKAEYIDPISHLNKPQPVTIADLQAVWKPFAAEAWQKAPNHADKIWSMAGAGGVTGGSSEWAALKYATGRPVGGGAATPPETEIPTTGEPPAYTPKPIPDTSYQMSPQPPLTASAFPLPPGISGAMVPPSPDYSSAARWPGAPAPTADTGMRSLSQSQLKDANILRGQQYPLQAPTMTPGFGAALAGPLVPPDFTRPRAGAEAPAGAAARPAGGAGPAIGSTITTKTGTYKIKGKNPDGSYEVE